MGGIWRFELQAAGEEKENEEMAVVVKTNGILFWGFSVHRPV